MTITRSMILAAALVLSGCSLGSDLPKADNAIADFHADMNAGQFDHAFDAANDVMKAAAPRAQFTALLGAVHKKLGAFKSGQRTGWNEYAGTGGHVLNISYAANYERGAAVETYVFDISGDGAKLQGFNINSPALVIN